MVLQTVYPHTDKSVIFPTGNYFGEFSFEIILKPMYIASETVPTVRRGSGNSGWTEGKHLRDNCFDKASRLRSKSGARGSPKTFFINVAKYLHVAALWSAPAFFSRLFSPRFSPRPSRHGLFPQVSLRPGPVPARISPAAWLCRLSGRSAFLAGNSGWWPPPPRCWKPHKSHCHSKWINFRGRLTYTLLFRTQTTHSTGPTPYVCLFESVFTSIFRVYCGFKMIRF